MTRSSATTNTAPSIDGRGFLGRDRLGPAEPEAEAIKDALLEAPLLFMSAFNVFETKTVMLRQFPGNFSKFEILLDNLGVCILAFDARQATMAFEAYQRYGKGSGHPAQLNLGDCAAYALARSLNLPLLFKGNDFIHTDVKPVL
jgi:ribonuclease VapC